MSTRRAFLGTLGKLLGAGGVLLPVAGKGALALPADLGKAAALPVAPAPLPASPQLLQLREIRRELHGIYLWDNSKTRTAAWRDVMVNKHTPTAAQIVGRKNPTWQDCVEIAEVCLHRMRRQYPADPTDPMRALVWAVLNAGGVNEVIVPEVGNFSPGEETL
jgi:hypothetical protein